MNRTAAKTISSDDEVKTTLRKCREGRGKRRYAGKEGEEEGRVARIPERGSESPCAEGALTMDKH